MANTEVSIVVRGRHQGKHVNWSVERARGSCRRHLLAEFYQVAKQCWDGPYNHLGTRSRVVSVMSANSGVASWQHQRLEVPTVLRRQAQKA